MMATQQQYRIFNRKLRIILIWIGLGLLLYITHRNETKPRTDEEIQEYLLRRNR